MRLKENTFSLQRLKENMFSLDANLESHLFQSFSLWYHPEKISLRYINWTGANSCNLKQHDVIDDGIFATHCVQGYF